MLRKEHRLSQEGLAEKLGVSRQTISRWEHGVSIPTAENLAKLSELFQVPVMALLKNGWTPPEETVPAVRTQEPPAEIPLCVTIQPPVSVPVSRPKLRPLAAALLLAAGITVGVVGTLFFREWRANMNTVPNTELERSVIGSSEIVEYMPMFPLK